MILLEEGGACPSCVEAYRFFIHNLTGFVSDKKFNYGKDTRVSMDINGKNAAEYIKRNIKNKHGNF